MSNKFIFSILMLINISAIASEDAYSHPDHCTPEEVTVFSCRIKDKFLSLCGTLEPSKSLFYRYGKLGAPELTFPKSKDNSITKFKKGVSRKSTGAGMMYIYFSISSYKYYIYRKFAYNDEFEGVAIYKGNKFIADLECDSHIQFDNWGLSSELNLKKENSELMDKYISN